MARSALIHSLVLTMALLLPACENATRTVAQRSEAAPSNPTHASYFTRAELASAIAAIRQRLGEPVNSLRLEVLPDRVVLQAQDPVHPSRVEQYEYRNGTLSAPVSVDLVGPGTLEPNLFPLREVPVDSVESMVAEAIARVDPKHGMPVRLVARRGLPHTPGVRIRLFVRSPGFDGHADFDSKGRAL